MTAPSASPAPTARTAGTARIARTSGRHGRWSAARGGLHWAEWGSELVGTALLLLGGLSAVVFDFGSGSPVAAAIPEPSPRLLLTGALFAATGVLVTISPLGRRSGAHLNPAVTLAFWFTGHVHPIDLAGYVVSQCLGAILGAALIAAVWGSRAASVHDGVTMPGPGVTPIAGVGIEALMTGAMILTILLFLSSPRTMRWTPLAVWVAVTLLVWQGAPYTGTSMNPARSLGPALVSGRLADLWIYVAGPLLGAVLAVAIDRVLMPDVAPLTAKLFHLRQDVPTSLGHFPAAVEAAAAAVRRG